MNVLSGMGPTGRLHIGHYHGVLKNWIELQKHHECRFMVADLAALATNYQSPEIIQKSIQDMVIDWLSVGIDPEKSTIFIQSQVPEHVQLAWLLGMVTPLTMAESVPAYKEKKQKLKNSDLATYGFLGDPIMQAADILLYKTELVPVGADSVHHLDFAKDLAQRFNDLYFSKVGGDVFKIPEASIFSATCLPGVDGEKMSKSYGNTIMLRSDDEHIKNTIKGVETKQELGRVGDCPVFKLRQVYANTDTDKIENIKVECEDKQLTCSDCKAGLSTEIGLDQVDIRERANYYANNPHVLREILSEGCKKASQSAKKTIDEIKHAMGLSYLDFNIN